MMFEEFTISLSDIWFTICNNFSLEVSPKNNNLYNIKKEIPNYLIEHIEHVFFSNSLLISWFVFHPSLQDIC